MTSNEIRNIFPFVPKSDKVAVVEVNGGTLYCLHPVLVETEQTLEVNVPYAGQSSEGGTFSLRKKIAVRNIKRAQWTELLGEKAAISMNNSESVATLL